MRDGRLFKTQDVKSLTVFKKNPKISVGIQMVSKFPEQNVGNNSAGLPYRGSSLLPVGTELWIGKFCLRCHFSRSQSPNKENGTSLPNGKSKQAANE